MRTSRTGTTLPREFPGWIFSIFMFNLNEATKMACSWLDQSRLIMIDLGGVKKVCRGLAVVRDLGSRP